MDKWDSKSRKNQAKVSTPALSDEELDQVSGGTGTGPSWTCSECGGKLFPLQPMPSRSGQGEYMCQKCRKIFYI